jgi:hypothetical protein
MGQHVDLGIVSNPQVREYDEQATVYQLNVTTSHKGVVTLQVSKSALRSLWSYLTKILYPRAADQLTERVSTVTRRKNVPPDITYMITADEDESQAGMIVVQGLVAKASWSMRLDRETGDALWVALEDLLDRV